LNALDLAISGQGFFAMKPNLTSSQTVYTRNGSFSVNNDRYVVDDKGQYLQVFPVNDDGSVTSTGAASATNLQLPVKSGLPNATKTIQLGLNLPADASIIPSDPKYTASNPYVFNHNDATTFNKSTSITIYDSLGNPTISTIYYVKTSNSTDTSPSNKWQTHVFVGDKELEPALITAKDTQARTLYINKFGQTTTDPTSFDPSFVANQPSPLYYQDDQVHKSSSTPAVVKGAIQNQTGFDFGDTDANKVTITNESSDYANTREGGNKSPTSPFWGKDMFTISVDGSAPQKISVNAGSYTGDELAAEMTRAVNSKFSDSNYFRITDTYRDEAGGVVSGNDVFNINLSKTKSDGTTVDLNPPLEIDLLGTAGAPGTPQNGAPQQLNYQDLTRDQLISIAQDKVNQALNNRHNEFGQSDNWVDTMNPPIKVGFDVASRSLTFTVDPAQLGADASLPTNRFQTIQVSNPTGTPNDLGLPPITASAKSIIGTNSKWTGEAVLPQGPPITAVGDQRTGILVSYNKDTRQFEFRSGTTGEASSIKVGRSSLASTGDILQQINSYDFSSKTLADGATLNIESDGRAFTYTNTTGAPLSAKDIILNLQQSMPVQFSDTMRMSVGSSTAMETQSLVQYGNLLNGDEFTLNVQLSKDPTVAAQPITVGQLVFAPTDDATARLLKLRDAINSAITTTVGSSTTMFHPYASASNGTITFTYDSVGVVGSAASLKQTTRGISDGASNTQTAIHYTDQTITTSPSIVSTPGNAKTAEVQETTLQPQQLGQSVSIAVGDKFQVTIPLADGSVTSQIVTVGGSGGIAGLAAALNTVTPSLPTTFSVSSSNTNTLQMAYNAVGSINGTFSLKQIGIGANAVRPNTIGPFSIGYAADGPRLEILGNPNGEPFRMNVQLAGTVQPAEAEGAAGSKSQTGRQVGESLATNTNTGALYAGNNDLLGIGATKSETTVAGTGLASTAAVATGATAITPMNQTFLLNESLGENKMTFTIDGITGSIALPIRAYTGDTFAAAIQQRINEIQDPTTGRVVSGATVKFDPTNNRLIFASGTTGSTSQFNVVGPANFGLNNVSKTAGTVPQITNLTTAKDSNGNPLYVDASGKITTVAPTNKIQSWSPLYLTPGELTFDTSGKLTSPSQGVVYSPFNPGNGANPLNLTIDYGKYSTQYQQPFSVLSLQQDGYTSGQLDGLNIDANGTVRANYTNGQTKALGKIILANFANPNGLKQIGNSNYVANSVSGDAVLGQAGADGFGSIQSGALERSNVDITEELVDLITAQRNFQANSKAIETETTLTTTIIQIRG
jgi:flagellar hook protein FlgE